MRKALLLIALLLPSAFAFVKIVSPVDVAVKPLAEIAISPVGPGQEVVLQFQRETNESIYWDSVQIANKIDPDWITTNRSDSNYIYYSIKVPPNKPAGANPFRLKIIDREGLIRSEEAEIKLYVTRDPSDLIEVIGFEQDYNFYADEEGTALLAINNKALSLATYNITVSVTGAPEAGGTYNVTVDPKETGYAEIPVKLKKEGLYTLNALVWSPDNPAIQEKAKAKIYVRPTLKSKFKNIGQGFPMIPITMAPFYAVLGVLGF